MAAQSGGVANPALLAENLATGAGTQSSQTAVQLGSIASQQHLQAMEAALQGTLAQGSEYTAAESAAGGIWQRPIGQSTRASRRVTRSPTRSTPLGIQSQELSTGANLLGNAGSSIGSILDQVYQSAQAESGGGAGGFLGGLMSLAPLLMGA